MPAAVLPDLDQRRSPNQSQRTHGNSAVDLIIVHTPEGGYAGALATCLNPSAEVSYHVLISENGTKATQLVPWDRKAWHAKVHNSRSEGLSLAGFAASTFPLSPGGRVLARAVAYRLKARGLKPVWRRRGGVGGGFCRHADLQSDRRDPMNLARWATFVTLVKWEHGRGRFRHHWGEGEPNRIPS